MFFKRLNDKDLCPLTLTFVGNESNISGSESHDPSATCNTDTHYTGQEQKPETLVQLARRSGPIKMVKLRNKLFIILVVVWELFRHPIFISAPTVLSQKQIS